MIPVTKLRNLGSSASETSQVVSESRNETGLVLQNSVSAAGALPTVSSGLDAPATMTKKSDATDNEQPINKLCYEKINFHLQVKEEKFDTDFINESNKGTIIKSDGNQYNQNIEISKIKTEKNENDYINECKNEDNQEIEYRDIKTEIEFEFEEEPITNEQCITDEKVSIKTEPVEDTEDQVGMAVGEVAGNFSCAETIEYEIKNEIQLSIKRENMSDTIMDDVSNNPTTQEEYKIVTEHQKMRNNQSATLPCYTQLVAAQTSNYAPIKDRTLFKNENNLATLANSTYTIKASTSTALVKPFICDMCSKSFQLKSALSRHITRHPKLLNCTYCRYKTCRKNDLTRHVNAVHIKNASFNCSYCSYKTCRKNDLSQHVNASHTKSKSFDCSYCDYKTYRKELLTRHVNAKHTKSISYNCTFCSYKTYRKGDLSQHINGIHAQNTSFNCPDCSYKTHRKDFLSRHTNAVHTKSVSFTCTFCSYETYHKGDLSRHINATHTKSTSFDCTYCSYKTYHKAHLSRHVNTKHTKMVSFKCSYCSFQTNNKGYLRQHINTAHTKSISFDCSYCSYKTYHKGDLGKHINAKHTKSISFNCSHCSYKTYRKFVLNRHINKMHNKN